MSPSPRRPSGDNVGSRRDRALSFSRQWIRAPGALVPSAALVIDHRMIRPFDPAGLGLACVSRWSDDAAPLPTASHLALDLSDESAITLTYLAHKDDHEASLVHWGFHDAHPAAWLSALTTDDRALLVVGDSTAISQAQTPPATTLALTNVWAGIIGCSDTCVIQAATPHAACARHSPRRSPPWSVAAGL
ncbi:hypothetical protein [Williamsia limnetica]|uniref:hypothetical protein n=1 Tax=Williamsia limnetica TaxID=882452 RepID=UPI0011B5967B|nr:hypothetical protein [Williamsia limnetica]